MPPAAAPSEDGAETMTEPDYAIFQGFMCPHSLRNSLTPRPKACMNSAPD
jgi:hypothetical protein